MAYRSFTPLATRKSPAFRGRALYLDGVSDFIDLQGETSPCFWRDSRTRASSNVLFRPASWACWVKFPQATIDQVLADDAADLDMNTFIISEGSSDQTDGAHAWSHCFAGLIGTATSVKFAVGWGVYNSGGVTPANRVIRYTSTAIVADTWYHIAWSHDGVTGAVDGTPAPNGNSWDTGLSVWINGNIHKYSHGNLLPYYPGQGLTELAPGTICSNAGADTLQTGFQKAYIGRRGNQYTEMTISECACWEGVSLDTEDIDVLYDQGSPRPDLFSNGDPGDVYGYPYDKGSISGVKLIFNFTSYQNDPFQFKIADFNNKVIVYESITNANSNLATGDTFGNTNNSKTAVNISSNSNLDNMATQFAAAVNTIHGHGQNGFGTTAPVSAQSSQYSDGGDLYGAGFNFSPYVTTNYVDYNSSYVKANAFNDTSNTAWIATPRPDGFIKFTSGTGVPERIFKMNLNSSQWNQFKITGFDWESSQDDTTWTLEQTLTFTGSTNAQDHLFDSTNSAALYWRMVNITHGGQTNTSGLRINNLRIHKANYIAGTAGTLGDLPTKGFNHIYATSDGAEVTLELGQGGDDINAGNGVKGTGYAFIEDVQKVDNVTNINFSNNIAYFGFDQAELADTALATSIATSATINSSNKITFTADAGTDRVYPITPTLIVGKQYVISATITGYSDSSGADVCGFDSVGGIPNTARRASNGTIGPTVFTADGGDVRAFAHTGVACVIDDISVKRYYPGAGSGNAVNSGIMGWWRFLGAGVDTSVSVLQSTSNRVSTAAGFDANGTDASINPPAQTLYTGQLCLAQPAINNGGTYVADHPTYS